MKNKITSIVLIVSAVICVLSAILMIVALSSNKKFDDDFAVKFDENASLGYPDIYEEQQLYIVTNKNENFEAYVCYYALTEGKKITVGFTNPSHNNVLMQLFVYGKNDRYLGNTDFIKAGEYIMDFELTKKPKDGEMLKYKVICYEDGTYYSAGVAVGEGTAISEFSK